MFIIDINGKKRKAISVKGVLYPKIDVVTDKVIEQARYVLVVIEGIKGNTWKEWYPLEEFRKMNPTLEI